MGFAPDPLFYIPAASAFVTSIFLGVWAAIALMKLVRIVPGLHAVYTARDRCRTFPTDLESQLPLWLETNGEGRHAELKLCDAVPGATVLGFQRPCVALPLSLVTALAREELDQILLHEHAHVRRRDDWARLLQSLVQAALWVHPAVAYIGRAIDREREMACDEWVVARTGLPKAYARCLAHAAELRGRARFEPMLVATLFQRRHDLVHRIERLLAVKGRTRRHVSSLAATAATVIIFVTSVHLNAFPLVGEYVEMVLPRVQPIVRLVEAVVPSAILEMEVVGGQTRGVAFKGSVRGRQTVGSGLEPRETAEPYEPHEPAGLDGPAEPPEPKDPVLLSARAFTGSYARSDASPAKTDESIRWSAAAAPGVGIARAARKTGVGLAGVLTRTGVSVAKSF